MKKLSYILFAFSLFIFLISLIGFFLGQMPVQTQIFYASVNITDENIVGFDVNSTALSFGKIGSGGDSIRKIQIQNGFNFPVAAVIQTEGDIGRLLNFEKVVEIGEGESRKIEFSASALPDTKEGFYSGNVSFELYKLK